jgi:hypothetical protein
VGISTANHISCCPESPRVNLPHPTHLPGKLTKSSAVFMV